MFKIHRQPPGEGAVKKSIQKLLDPKKDVIARLKHLRNVTVNSTDAEVQSLFELHYSHIYFIFFENFLLVEQNLHQKGSHRAQREELDAILLIFEQILTNLPELVHQRWQYHSIDMVIKRLLHTQNSLKVRREGMHFFLLWLRALQDNVLPQTLLLYACLVPGFPPPKCSNGKPCSLEWLVNMPINEEYGVHQIEISCLVPPSSGDKNPSDLTKYFLDSLLEFMVLKSHVLRWKDEERMAKQCFNFMWNLFKEKYLPHAFTDFDHSTSIYSPCLGLPEPRESVNYVLNVSDTGSLDPRIEVATGCCMLSARVSIIKWIVNFTGRFEKNDMTLVKRPDATVEALHRQVLKQLLEFHLSNNEKMLDGQEGRVSISNVHANSTLTPHTAAHVHDMDASNSNTSTLTEKEPSLSSLSSLDDKLRSSASAEDTLVRSVLYSTRENVDLIHELFRQAFMLPLTEVPTMRRVVKVYQEWIQDGDLPIFMEGSSDDENDIEKDLAEKTEKVQRETLSSSSSVRNVSYMRGQLNSVLEEAISTNVRAGCQSTLQLFVTNSAHVFLVEPPRNAIKLVETQVDVCKRVLNLYRYMVMNVPLSVTTWRQLLRVLLHITRSMLQDAGDDESDANKQQTVSGRLAGPVFQTLIVSWIKANLFVHVSRELWDELVEVLSSLTNWRELIIEWAKNMETMTRVLARHVYKLELQDLPLDRLTEQKHKKQRKLGAGNKPAKQASYPPLLSERSFSRGWSRDSEPSLTSDISGTESRKRSHSALVSRARTELTDVEEKSDARMSNVGNDSIRKPRSATSSTNANLPIITTTFDHPLKKGTSDSAGLPTATIDGSSQFRRRNSASDINATPADKPLPPVRHRSDSDGIHGVEASPPRLGDAPGGNVLHVAWQIPAAHDVNSFHGELDSTSISVTSVEADDEFDELIHERLHTDDSGKDTISRDSWPMEGSSLHSQDSISIDPDWNPFADNQPSRGLQASASGSVASQEDRYAPDLSLFVPRSIMRDTSDLPFADASPEGVAMPIPSRRNISEDTVVNSPGSGISFTDLAHLSRDTPPLPIPTDTPPAIPARVALPLSQFSLFEINFVSSRGGSPEPVTPTSVSSGALPQDDSSCATTPSSGPAASYCAPDTPDLSLPGPTHCTNAAQSNQPVTPTDVVSLLESAINVRRSLPDQLNQKSPGRRSDSPGQQHDDRTGHRDNGEISVELEAESKGIPAITTPRAGGKSSVAADNRRAGDRKEEPDLLGTSSEDILLENCTAPFQDNAGKRPTTLNNDTDCNDEENQQKKTDAHNQDCSIMAGGQKSGWFPDVAVALWRRLLGILGDVNKIDDGEIHELVFNYLLELWGILFKMRQNLGIQNDTCPPQDSPELVPPLRILAPWGFKAAMSLPDTHKGGKLHAYQLLCKMTVQREHDTALEPDHLPQFYAVLHNALHSTDPDVVNEIVGSCGRYFSSCLPASTLLLLDFIYACHSVAASQDLKAPRVEAQTILGSILCFPNLYLDIPVLKPDATHPSSMICNNIKDYIVEALVAAGKKEPSAPARCVALSSTGLWLYEELTTTHTKHARLKEAINVLLVSLKFSTRTVASVACSQLHLLTHCSEELRRTMPDMPPRIIEVMSLTVSALLNGTEAKNTETGRQLLVSLLLCILDWCMCVPLELLTDTYGTNTDKRLIRTVFKAMQTAALGKPGHSAKHSYSLSDLASQDFDPNLPLDKVQDPPGGLFGNNRPKVAPRSNTGKLGKDGAVSLVAHTVLSHLTTHLGHFPLARGTSVLTCRVSEHHDVEDTPDELSDKLFESPNVQFLILNDSCLLSVVEIPAENDQPDDGSTAGMSSSNRCVRFVVRDAGGKYCWDSSILYGPPEIEDVTRPVRCVPLSTLDEEISKVAIESCRSYRDYARAEDNTKRQVTPADLPHHKVASSSEASDQLEQLLQYVGWSSPECQTQIGLPLNIPGPTPACLTDDLQSNATKCLLHHHENLGASYVENAREKSWQCKSAQPSRTVRSHSPFYHARLLCTELGFLSRDSRDRVSLLKKNERLLRELKNLDSRHCRETHKVAVFYIAQGQEDKLSILSNSGGSKEYEAFVAGLGWEVDLSVHCGFRGKLESDGGNGRTAPYYATSALEVVFHVATRFPSTDDDARNVKLKHLGNDEVHIVWSEHHRDYRRGIIPTEFGDVLIIIYPIRHNFYRVQINKKPDVPYFGPLFDGAIVTARLLPVLVRETAINAGRAKRSQISLYQPYSFTTINRTILTACLTFKSDGTPITVSRAWLGVRDISYEERTSYLRRIIEQFKDDQTFEDYSADLFCPVSSSLLNPERQKSSVVQSDGGQRVRAAVGAAATDGLNTNGNSNVALNSGESHHNVFKGAAKRIQQSSLFGHDFAQPAATSESNSAVNRAVPHVPHSSHIGSTVKALVSLRPLANQSHLQPPSSPVPLSSSAPSSGRTRHHVSFRSSSLQRNVGGGSQPHLANLGFPTISEFPTPPHSPPSTGSFNPPSG